VFRDKSVGQDVDVEKAVERPTEAGQAEEAKAKKHSLKLERTLTPTRRVTQQGVSFTLNQYTNDVSSYR